MSASLPGNVTSPYRMAADELRVGRVIGPLAVVFFPVYWHPWESSARLGFTVIGVALGCAVTGAVWWGNRIAGATAAFCLGLFGPWDFLFVIGAVYVGFSGWLGVRAARDARESTPRPPEP